MMTAVSFEATFGGYAALAAEPAQSTSQSAAPADDLTEITVTGYRASLETALESKRKSVLPIDSVAPEDIGKMPDQNVAESLQRLPGVQIDRANGQGTAVLIDGLRQNLTTLNGDVFLTGKEFYVSGEGSGGGAGGNSQYGSLEGIPSELVSGIDVYKNPKASMTEGGLGGTIDLKTRDPLAQPMGLSLGGNFRESKAQNTSGLTPDGTVVASYKVNDRLGFTGSFTFDNEKTHIKEFQDQNRNQWLITNSATGPYVGALTPAGLSTLPGGKYYIDPQLAYFTDSYDDRKKRGASLGVTFKVTDSITTSLNWFYSREDDTTYSYSDKAWFNGQGSAAGALLPGIDPTKPYSIDGNGVVGNGTFNANGAETASLFQENISKANNYQWATKFDNGGPIRANLDGSYAKANSDLQAAQADVEHGLYLTSAGVATSPAAPGCNNGASTCAGAGSHGYEFNYANGGTSGLPSVSYLSPYADILNNPAYTTFKSNWAWANKTEEKQFAIKGEVQYDLPFITAATSTVTAGVRYAGRSVDQNFGRYLINGTLADGTVAGDVGGGAVAGPYLYYQDPGYGTPNIPYSTATSNPSLASVVPNFAVGNIIVKNPSVGGMNNPATYLQQVWAGAGVPNTTEKLFKDGLSSFNVRERTTAPYLMFDMGGPTSPYHLNAGVRLVKTDLTIDNGQTAAVPTYYGTASWNGVDSNVVPVQTKRSYNDVLPSLNFVYDLTDSQKLRFGLAKVMSPQDLFSLGLGNSYNFTRQINVRTNVNTGVADGFAFAGGSSGNAQLDPYRAKQMYLSYENYFAPGALASVATFYKKVDNFVETQNIPTVVTDDFGGTSADVTKPVNAGHGKIYGLEFGAQYALGADIAWLQGLGVAANYTFSHSESDQTTAFSYDSPIPGVSKNSVTGTLYYERAGFSARGSYSWRDKAVNDSLVGSTFAFNDAAGVNKVYQVFSAPYGQLDAQVGYDINSHIGLVVQAINVTNEVQHTYLQWPNLPFSYDDTGRRFFFGFKGKL
jgi:iron complex outermembrane receptor protein